MKLYVPSVVEGQQWLLPEDDADFERFAGLAGRRQEGWRPPRMKLLRQREDSTPRGRSDFPWFGEHVLMVRDAAARALAADFGPYGEFLPLRAEEPMLAFNVTRVIDALDEERSSIVRFDDGSILAIERHVFRPEAIGDALMFKLPEGAGGLRVSSIYLREEMVRRIGELGLEGIGFELVWSDEGGRQDGHEDGPEGGRVEYAGGAGVARPPARSVWNVMADWLGPATRRPR